MKIESQFDNKELDSSMEESSLSEQYPNGETGIKSQSTYSNGRKRKVIPKGNGIETHSSTLSAKDSKEPEKEVSDAKRSKSGEEGNGIGKENEEGNQKLTKENAKPEPPKDYTHVRARRGQATDSHSLAEREKLLCSTRL
ncbi:putative basic helix-loop-helix leucine zipper transcription factor [Helianthus debilis subsp. tardiflorus]